jgi:hypothetical protein
MAAFGRRNRRNEPTWKAQEVSEIDFQNLNLFLLQ